MNGANGQVQVPAALPITVTLEARYWGEIINLLREVPAPHRVTDPLIQVLSEQFQKQAQPQLNGADIEAFAGA
jgi:hypothetical protein